MTYNIHEIELNGETNISRFNNKKEVQKYLNDNYYVIVEKIERETKKAVTDVTDQFEIQHLADSAESVELENHIEKSREDLINWVEKNDNMEFHEVVRAVIEHYEKYGSDEPSSVDGLVFLDINYFEVKLERIRSVNEYYDTDLYNNKLALTAFRRIKELYIDVRGNGNE